MIAFCPATFESALFFAILNNFYENFNLFSWVLALKAAGLI